MNIVSVIDVASYIINRMKEVYKIKEVSTWKLQKLVYYCQVWHLIWHDRPLFDEDILAWINGPVCKELYELHKGKFAISKIRGIANLDSDQKEVADRIVSFYGKRSAQWLVDLIHLEDPWRNTRKNIGPSERGNEVINHESIVEYYSSLPVMSEEEERTL